MKVTINQFRKKVLLNGFAGVTEVMVFLKCGNPKAKEIMNEIFDDLSKENKKTIPGKVPSKRLLPYIHLTEAKIFEYADIEAKEKSLLQ